MKSKILWLIYKRLRPGDLAAVDSAKHLIGNMFNNFDRYDFGIVYNKVMEMGGLSIGKKVKLILDIQLNSNH